MPVKFFSDTLFKSGGNEAFVIYISLDSLKGDCTDAVHMIYLTVPWAERDPHLQCWGRLCRSSREAFLSQTSGQKEESCEACLWRPPWQEQAQADASPANGTAKVQPPCGAGVYPHKG